LLVALFLYLKSFLYLLCIFLFQYGVRADRVPQKEKEDTREEWAEPIEAKGDNHMMVDQVMRFLKTTK